MDILTREQRTERMRRVRQRGTEPELAVRRALHGLGYRFRLNRRDLPGSPDIVLPRHRAAIFVHGCFWHSHANCRLATVPKTRAEYWVAKLAENRQRDWRAQTALEDEGWRVLTVWQCETRDTEGLAVGLAKFLICSHAPA